MSPLSTTDLQKTLKINGAICTTAWAGPCSVRLWLDVGQCIYICSLARLQEIFEPQNTIYSLYMICPTDPPQKNQKNPEKNPSKGHPRARTLLEFKEKFPDQFSQCANNVGTPLFRSMRQAQNTDIHALNQLGVFQNSSPL